MSDEKHLPKHIGGYQHIHQCPVEDGDIWVRDGAPFSFVHESWFGQPARDVAGFGLYRKLAVLKQGGAEYNK